MINHTKHFRLLFIYLLLALSLGNPKAANIVLLGVLIGATGIVSREAFVTSLEEKFKAKKPEVLAMNLQALDQGIALGKK